MKLLLQAFAGTNKQTPVWFMRQAGRYLPQYQKIRAKFSLDEMFGRPELAAEVTCLPVDILKVDAAILFADILTLPAAMGFSIRFDKNNGPVIANPLTKAVDLKKIHDASTFPNITKTIQLTKQRLPNNIALIGFAGAPFTVLSYLIEGGSSTNFKKTLQCAYQSPQFFKKAMDLITRNTITYLNAQRQSGIDAFQLFDTWGGIWPQAEYERFVLPYVQRIFRSVKLPSIYYLKNCRHLLTSMKKSGSHFLSVCETVSLGHEPKLENITQGIQGNLYNGYLYADTKTLRHQVKSVLQRGRSYPKYIFNLGHGVFPDTSVEKLKKIVELVHE